MPKDMSKGVTQAIKDSAAGSPMSSYLDVMADFLAEADYDGLPPQVIEHAKTVIMDTLGIILMTSDVNEATNLSSFILAQGGVKDATIFRRGFPQADVSSAALVNGTAATFLILDESHPTTGHHAVHIVPAALAMAEGLQVNGKKLVEALVLGYEIAARLGGACQRREGIHPHGHVGLVGAATACAKLMGFGQEKIKETINASSCLTLATSMEARLEGAPVTNLWAGLSAGLGTLAPRLVENGFTGPTDGLSETFGNLSCQDFSPQKLVEGLGETHEITRNTFRLYACCGETHAAIDAIRDIIKEKPLQPDEISHIEVYTYEGAAQLTSQHPDNPQAAKFSIPYVVAAMIVRHSCGIDSFEPEVIADQDTQALAGKVDVFEDPALTERWPEDFSARVVVTLEGGETLTKFCENARGKRKNPLPAKELEDKFRVLTAAFFTPEGLDKVVQAMRHIDDFENVRDFTALLRGVSLEA
jgi:2-methylcitrate dehydratase PrpD